MRIAVVAPLVTPLGLMQIGGSQAFLTDLAQGLAARGHRVTLYCAEGSEVPGVDSVQIPVDAAARAALVMPGGPPARSSAALRAGFERLYRELRRTGYDAVSQHAFDAEAIDLAAGLRALHTLHLPPIVPSVVDACRRCRQPLATVSTSSWHAWRRAGLHRLRILRNGVPDPGVEELAIPRAGDALIAGRISPEKGVAAGIVAAQRAGLRPLVVGGVFDRGYFERDVAPLLEGTALRPGVPRAELWRMMERSEVTLMPVEWEEPFGLVAAESQVVGTPVVAYRRGALPEVVEDGVSGYLVPPGDLDAFVESIKRARGLDRGRVRRSARRRLLIGPVLDAYERALATVGGAA